MGRKKGTPAYRHKTWATSCILQPEARLKLKDAERRTGKSRSDVINFCLLHAADKITREMFDRKSEANDKATAAATA